MAITRDMEARNDHLFVANALEVKVKAFGVGFAGGKGGRVVHEKKFMTLENGALQRFSRANVVSGLSNHRSGLG